MPYIPPHIQKLKPYQSARDLYQGDYLFMDANENCFGPLVGPADLVNSDGTSGVHVSDYPDTDSTKLRDALADMYGIDSNEMAIFNGSDASIPEILLTFSDHGGKVGGLDIGFGMYRSFCEIHERKYVQIPTNEEFEVVMDDDTNTLFDNMQICFLDVPNNPSGKAQSVECIEWMASHKDTLFVLDLAYYGFIDDDEEGQRIKAYIQECTKRDNFLVMYSFSKTWSMAGGRIGVVFGNTNLIAELIKVRIPYHVSVMAEALGVAALNKKDEMQRRCDLIRQYRSDLEKELTLLGLKVYPSQANFLLVKFPGNSQEIFDKLVEECRIVLRYFGGGDALAGKDSKLAHCIRITVGLPQQNQKLIVALKKILTD